VQNDYLKIKKESFRKFWAAADTSQTHTDQESVYESQQWW